MLYNDFRSGGNADLHFTTATFFSAANAGESRCRALNYGKNMFALLRTSKTDSQTIQLLFLVNGIILCHLCNEICRPQFEQIIIKFLLGKLFFQTLYLQLENTQRQSIVMYHSGSQS